jgi:hypothetical protein
MTKFIIESSHNKEDCLKALDEMSAKDRDLLSKTECGCNEGNHTCWASVEGKSASEVKDRMPSSLRSKSEVYKVDTFTPDQIKSFHEM